MESLYLLFKIQFNLRYFVEISYLGKNYHGWQVQPNVITVQEKINSAFSLILGTPIHVMGAGRTDTGVHASQMFVHLDSDSELSNETHLYKLNSVLPNDIAIHNIFQVKDNAHTRFNAIQRSYEYKIYLGRDPFQLDTTWQFFKSELNVNNMNKAATILKNHTNFKCFSKSKTDVSTYNCTITNAEWILKDKSLTFHITADRFLRNMVRAIVGTLVSIGQGKNTVEDMSKIIESENRSKAGTSAPAQGLSLTKISYPENIKHG